MELCTRDLPRVRRSDLDERPRTDLEALAAIGKALSDPIRLQMLHLLGQRADLCTCELEDLLGLGQSRVSYHLKVLLEAGLVARETYGTWSHYSLRAPDVVERLRDLASAPSIDVPAVAG